MKVAPFVPPINEAIDVSKDVYYSVKTPHKKQWIVWALWFFILFPILLTFLRVLFMSAIEFEERFDVKISNKSFLRIVWIKSKYALGEALNFHDPKKFHDEAV